MMLQPIMRICDDAVSDIMMLYDANGHAIGAWCKRTGRAMLGDAFYVREDSNVDRERTINDERDYAWVDLSKRAADPIDHSCQIDCRTYQTSRSSTRQSINGNIGYQGW